MTSRFRGLAAAGALALPAAALTALLPGAAAQAVTICNAYQATITFADGSTTCQSVGPAIYQPQNRGQFVQSICAGDHAIVLPIGPVLDAPGIRPGKCSTDIWRGPDLLVTVVPA